MTLHFDCTACGRCCDSLRLPVSIREAIQWIEEGGTVQLMCDASPDLPLNETDTAEVFRRERSFAADSRSLPIRVRLTLVAAFTGPCPNLLPNNLCGAYERRPATCRIYPAELRPDADITPSARLCPSAAWSSDKPLLVRHDRTIVDHEIVDAITLARHESCTDAPRKLRLSSLLGTNVAALANEGLVIWHIDQHLLLSALQQVASDPLPADRGSSSWSIASPTPAIREMIAGAGGAACALDELEGAQYLTLQ